MWHELSAYVVDNFDIYSFCYLTWRCECFLLWHRFHIYFLHSDKVFSYFAVWFTDVNVLCCYMISYIYIYIYDTLWIFVQLFRCHTYKWKCFLFWFIFRVYLWYILNIYLAIFLPHLRVSFFPVKAHISGLFLLHPDISCRYFPTWLTGKNCFLLWHTFHVHLVQLICCLIYKCKYLLFGTYTSIGKFW